MKNITAFFLSSILLLSAADVHAMDERDPDTSGSSPVAPKSQKTNPAAQPPKEAEKNGGMVDQSTQTDFPPTQTAPPQTKAALTQKNSPFLPLTLVPCHRGCYF